MVKKFLELMNTKIFYTPYIINTVWNVDQTIKSDDNSMIISMDISWENEKNVLDKQ